MTGYPVRVVRGPHANPHAPGSGYRYDGLFRVVDHWQARGRSGFLVWRYRMVRIGVAQVAEAVDHEENIPSRVSQTVQRIVRDTALARQVKEIYKFSCQVCGTRIVTQAGYYAQAAHIPPLGVPHCGPDVIENIICLCPNHHVMFDFRVFSVADDLSLIGLEGCLIEVAGHHVGREYLRHHRQLYCVDSGEN
tara:strand:+ start:1076 stop:1651 length:576 start_codon:yes stop_codon:yes gene_type:complete